MLRCSVKVTRKTRIPTIAKRLASASTRTLMQQAAYLRKVARSQVKKRKKSSAPGSPASDHGFYKRSLTFAVDRARGFAVIGPENKGNKSIPIALELGGTSRSKKGRQRVQARPLMRPSLAKSITKFKKIRTDNFGKAMR